MQLRMPHGRHISGGFFKALSELKPVPTEMTPRVVHGVLKANASCADSFCMDFTGHLITVSDVRSLRGNANAKADALAAEQIMSRAREVWAACKAESDGTAEIGDLDVAVVAALFGKDAEQRTVAQVTDTYFDALFDPQDPKLEKLRPRMQR